MADADAAPSPPATTDTPTAVSENSPPNENTPATKKKSPSTFLKTVLGRPCSVKLNSVSEFLRIEQQAYRALSLPPPLN